MVASQTDTSPFLLAHVRRIPPFWRRGVLLLGVLLLTWAGLMLYIDAPFFGHHDANGIWVGAAARTLLGQGALIPTIHYGAGPPDAAAVYVNHPPLIVWLSAGAQALFGDSELSLRFVFAASTLVSCAALYVLCRRLFGREQGLLALALYALTPAVLYFGRMPNHEPVALMFILLLAAVYVRWLREPSPMRWGVMLGLTVGAVWSAWASVFFIGALALAGLVYGKARQRWSAVALGAFAALQAGAVILFYGALNPDSYALLRFAFETRTGSREFVWQPFTWGEFTATTLLHMVTLVPLVTLLLGAVGLLFVVRDRNASRRAIILGMGVAGIAYIAIFRHVSYVHDYYKVFLVPFVTLSAVYVFAWAWSYVEKRGLFVMLVVGLGLPSLAFAVMHAAAWYSPSRDEMLLRMASYVASVSEPAQTVYTNMSYNPIVAYYAERDIVFGVEPGAATDERPDALYLYCGWVDAEQTGVTMDPQRPGIGCEARPLPGLVSDSSSGGTG